MFDNNYTTLSQHLPMCTREHLKLSSIGQYALRIIMEMRANNMGICFPVL